MIASEQIKGDARVLGSITAASGLGAFIGALFLASRKSVVGLERIPAFSALLFGVGLIFVGISHNIWFSLPMMLISGMGMMVQMASSNTILQTLVDEDKRARILSLFVMAYAGMTPFGSLFGGFLADHIGASRTLEMGGIVCCFGGVIFFRALPKIASSYKRKRFHLENMEITSEKTDMKTPMNKTDEVAILAGGCFWGMESILRRLPGVIDTTVGYTGGTTKYPTYEEVCTGKTGHAEGLEIVFDPAQITYEQVLRTFFRMHDPTTLNRQHNDVGTQYRSAIFTIGEKQRKWPSKLLMNSIKVESLTNPL